MQQLEEIYFEKISEEELDAIYLYLALHYDEMSLDEKLYWNYLLEKIDPDYAKQS